MLLLLGNLCLHDLPQQEIEKPGHPKGIGRADHNSQNVDSELVAVSVEKSSEGVSRIRSGKAARGNASPHRADPVAAEHVEGVGQLLEVFRFCVAEEVGKDSAQRSDDEGRPEGDITGAGGDGHQSAH